MSNTEQTLLLSDGRQLGYAEYGDPLGKPLFFFHGWPNSRLHGYVLDEPGKKLHIRIISVDRTGYGLSHNKPQRTLLHFAADIREVADILGIKKFAILGNSGGAPYAAACAYAIADRITNVGITVGLGPAFIPALLTGLPHLSNVGWRWYASFPPLTILVTYLLKLKAFRLSQFHFLDFYTPADMEVFKTFSLKTLQKRRQEAFRQGLAGPADDLLLYSKDWGFSLTDIHVPVYLWYGGKDKKVSLAMGEYYASQIKNSTLVIFPEEGHMIINTHTDEILKKLL